MNSRSARIGKHAVESDRLKGVVLGRGRCNDRNGYEEGAEILEHDCLTELID